MTQLAPPVRAALQTAGSVGGDLLGAVFGAVGHLRPAGKPLHPKGVSLAATVHRFGAGEVYGAPLLDEPGTDDAVVRLSRSVGLPDRLPDVPGLAVRLDPHGDPVDLLLATSGAGVIARFLFVPRFGALIADSPYSTVLPYRTSTGPVLIGALPHRQGDGSLRIALRVARPTGRWRDFGAIEIPELDGRRPDEEPRDDQRLGGVTFDPVLNQADGLAPYPWWARLREPSYSAARRSRGQDDAATR